MVSIQRYSPLSQRRQLKISFSGLIVVMFLWTFLSMSKSSQQHSRKAERKSEASSNPCPYMSLSDLTEDELSPQSGQRHMITPPRDDVITLVCCQTTAGPWSIAVHNSWAPLGANRFLEMVQDGYFSAQVPFMRCLRNFLCQFGLSGIPAITKKYLKTIPDDPMWLPTGPSHRENEKKVKRFAKGYLAYAGGGNNTRDNQFIVALKSNGPLAGGSPWEVPWGELVGKHSFVTLDNIYSGYDELGPTQGYLVNHGVTDEVKMKFPKLDYIISCTVVDQTSSNFGQH
jgi:peptidyl-prolyl cis-trans isomerase A (cyclophilin A)